MNILFISLGCDKNLVDTEVMLGILAEHGHRIVSEESEADVVVINTAVLSTTPWKRAFRIFWRWRS